MAKRNKKPATYKNPEIVSKVEEPSDITYNASTSDLGMNTFAINFGKAGKKELSVRMPYGYFIQPVRKARNYSDLNHLIGTEGFMLKDVKPLVKFLDLSNERFATLAGMSSRTISRWSDDDTIGVMASKTLLEVDRLSEKGSTIFGTKELFRSWLDQRNTALGDEKPIELLTEPYGVELVDDALEAMKYGNVM